jgi:hypothetical protein
MLKHVLNGLGWFTVVTFALNIAIKLFGSDQAVLDYAGSSRNLDTPITALAIGLIFLGLGSIISKLDQILQRDET